MGKHGNNQVENVPSKWGNLKEETPDMQKFEMPIGDSRGDVSRPLECPKFCKGYPDAQDPEPTLEELMVQL